MKKLFISAAHKSSGKTTITLGLCAALSARGMAVQSFKKGPDYIDPMWLSLASSQAAQALRRCRNLDFHTQSPADIRNLHETAAAGADIAIIEGNKGLYDGVNLDGSNSNAALARLCQSPIILVIDCEGMTRGIAPLLLGYRAFEPDLAMAGVILNKVGGPRHEEKLRAAIAHYTDFKVFGAVPKHADMVISERHLGLVPANEAAEARAVITRIGNIVAGHVNLDALLKAASTDDSTAGKKASASPAATMAAGTGRLRIAIARDSAFGFYYADDLAAFENAGVDLIAFNTMTDKALPKDIDALFIGGGFPETHSAALAANLPLKQHIKSAIENGLPAYAECGGLMYLSQAIGWQGQDWPMVGLLPGRAVMHQKPRGRGYVTLQATAAAPWPVSAGSDIHAHEFHYSVLEDIPTDTSVNGALTYAFDIKRGYGVDGQHDGIVYKNLLAAYTHLRHTPQTPWVDGFVDFVRQHRKP